MRLIFIGILICFLSPICFGQHEEAPGDHPNLSTNFFNHLTRKATLIQRHLGEQSEKCLARIARREAIIQRKLNKIDSNASKRLFAGTETEYANILQKLRQDKVNSQIAFTGEYQPYTDSMISSLLFLRHQTELLSSADKPSSILDKADNNIPRLSTKLQECINQFQILQVKMDNAGKLKEYFRQRRQLIGDYISQHGALAGRLGKQYQGMKEDLYYYSQSVRQYKEMLNDPGKLEFQALAILNKLPAFQAFMKQHSQLAGLFNLPSNYGDPVALAGLQTREEVSTLINSQVSAGGAGGQSALQANLQLAQGQLDGYKDKLSQLGGGSGDIDMPDFKPNNQKTKTFWKRLECGTNFQTTRSTYYFPTVTDLGLSMGYKINNISTIGIGASYKLGWGNGWNHIAFSSQGVGLRSFFDMKLKGSFFASGGFEYNYNTPFRSIQQLHNWADWSRSGLAGASKIISVKSRVFKKTKLSLLWDFLSYQQVPKTQPILFRLGYNL